MCKQRAGCNAGTLTAKSLVEAAARDVQAKGRLQPWSSKGWRLGLVEAAAKELEDACQEKVYAMWFDLGKLRRKSSTPAVVPGAAPALAKAGVGGHWTYAILRCYFLFTSITKEGTMVILRVGLETASADEVFLDLPKQGKTMIYQSI